MSFFFLGQNNSGGETITDEVIAGGVIIEAVSIDQANDIAGKLGVFDYWMCECCGERFSYLDSKSPYPPKAYQSVKEAYENEKQLIYTSDDVLCIVHFLDGRKVKIMKGDQL